MLTVALWRHQSFLQSPALLALPVPLALSEAEGSGVGGSEVEGPALSGVEGPALSEVEGNLEREPSVNPLRRVNWSISHSIGGSFGSATGQRGFTLLEMLVVVFIVLIMSAMAVPALFRSIRGYQLEGAARKVSNMIVREWSGTARARQGKQGRRFSLALDSPPPVLA